jgi:hypothetical protein
MTESKSSEKIYMIVALSEVFSLSHKSKHDTYAGLHVLEYLHVLGQCKYHIFIVSGKNNVPYDFWRFLFENKVLFTEMRLNLWSFTLQMLLCFNEEP